MFIFCANSPRMYYQSEARLYCCLEICTFGTHAYIFVDSVDTNNLLIAREKIKLIYYDCRLGAGMVASVCYLDFCG